MLSRLTFARTTVAIVVVVNLVLLSAYCWSRGGQTTHLRIEVRGDELTAYIDGQRSLQYRFEAPGEGELALEMAGTRGTSSLPSPSGLDHVTVKELDTGDVLLEDSFDGAGGPEWTATGATPRERDGMLLADDGVYLRMQGVSWRNYVVEAEYRNIIGAGFGVRAREREMVVYQFVAFRDPVQRVMDAGPDGQQEMVHRSPVDLDKTEILRGTVAMPLRAYPYMLAALGAAFAIVMGITVGARALSQRSAFAFEPPDIRPAVPYAIAAIGIAAFAVTLVLADRYQIRDPNWPDSVAYVFQAKIFASGRLAASAPSVPESFDYFFPPLMAIDGGRWSIIFPFGHPLALAPGQFVSAAWVVPPVLGAASVVLLFGYGRRIYDDLTAATAALLLASSPFFLMQASNLMSHNTAVFYLLAALLLASISARRPWLFGVLAGLCFGLLFNTRPLTAVALMPLFAFELTLDGWAPERRTPMLKRCAAFAAGALLMFGAYLLYNTITSGDPLGGSYGQSNSERLGFGGAHSLSLGMQHEQTEMAYLLLVLHAWPAFAGIFFVLMPFVLGTRNRHDWALLASALMVMGSYVVFSENGVMQGPRMWYEAVPLLMLLSARGFARSAEAALSVVRSFVSAAPPRAATVASYGLASACVVALVAYGTYSWLLGQGSGWDVLYVPSKPAELRGFNDVDNRLPQIVEVSGAEHALVLVNNCVHWQCYGSVFWRNSPDLDGDIVYARWPDGANLRTLLSAFPDRRVYVADYNAPYVLPYGMEGQAGTNFVLPNAEAPLASELLSLTVD